MLCDGHIKSGCLPYAGQLRLNDFLVPGLDVKFQLENSQQ